MGKKAKSAAKGQSASNSDYPALVADLLRLFVFVLLQAPLVASAVPSYTGTSTTSTTAATSSTEG